jgi:hypothetical protein
VGQQLRRPFDVDEGNGDQPPTGRNDRRSPAQVPARGVVARRVVPARHHDHLVACPLSHSSHFRGFVVLLDALS